MGAWHPLPTCSAQTLQVLPFHPCRRHFITSPFLKPPDLFPPRVSTGCSPAGAAQPQAPAAQARCCAGQVLCYGQPAPGSVRRLCPPEAQPLTPGKKVCWTPTLAGSVALGGCWAALRPAHRKLLHRNLCGVSAWAPGQSLPVTWAVVHPPMAPSCVHPRTLPSHFHTGI